MLNFQGGKVFTAEFGFQFILWVSLNFSPTPFH